MGQEVNAIIDQFPAHRVSTEEGLLLLVITAGGLILGLAMVWTLLKLRSGMQRRAEKRVAAVVVSTTDPVSTPENRPTKPPVAIRTAPTPRKPAFGRLKALMSPKAAAASKTAVQEPPRSRQDIIGEARDLARRAPTHPRAAMLRLSAVGDLRRLWQAGPGRRAPASGPWMRRAEDLAMAFMGGGFGRCFVGIEVYERYNFIRPAIPTSIWAVWVPKAALEPETLRDYEDWPRRVLPEDTRLADLEGPDILFSLPRDDQHRLLDVVNVERRASDRHLQSNGFAAGEVDQPPRNEVWWHQYVPWIGTIIFVIGTILVVMFRNSGGG